MNTTEVFNELKNAYTSKKFPNLDFERIISICDTDAPLDSNLRSEIIKILRCCFITNYNECFKLSIKCLQQIFNDRRFFALETENEQTESLISYQIIECLSCSAIPISFHIEVIKLIVDFTTSQNFPVNAMVLNLAMKFIIQISFVSNDEKLPLVMRASLAQIFENFTTKLKCQSSDCEYFHVNDSLNPHNKNPFYETRKKDIIDLLNFVLKNILIKEDVNNSDTLCSIYLNICYSILSNIPRCILLDKHFFDFIWQIFCPSLGHLLGNLTTSKNKNSIDVIQEPNTSIESAKLVYRIAVSLTVLVASIYSMKPVIESLYQKILLYSSSEFLYEAIKESRLLFSSPKNLLQIIGPYWFDEVVNDSSMCFRQFSTKIQKENIISNKRYGLIKMFLNALDKCINIYGSDLSYVLLSVTSAHDLFCTLELIAKKNSGIDNETLEQMILDQLSNINDRMEPICTSPPAVGKNMDESWILQAQNSSEDSQWASDFVMELMRLVPILIHQTSSFIDIDNLMMDFCSTYCLLKAKMEQDITSGNECEVNKPDSSRLKNFLLTKKKAVSCSTKDTWQIYVNADALYFAAYSVFIMNFQLIQSKYYTLDEDSIQTPCPISYNDFTKMVHPKGMLIYLPDTWMAVLYKTVREQNLLCLIGGLVVPACSGMEPMATNNFVRLLLDCSTKSWNYFNLPSDCNNFSEKFASRPRGSSGQLVVKTFLEISWMQLLGSLSGVVAEITVNRGSGFIKSPLGHLINWSPALISVRRQMEYENLPVNFISEQHQADNKQEIYNSSNGLKSHQYLVQLLTGQASREEQRRLGMVLCVGLLSLRRAAKLTSSLGLQSRCSSVFSLLVNACIISSASLTSTNFWSNLTASISSEDSKNSAELSGPARRMHLSEVLSLQTVLSGAIEMGIHAPECWDDVFRACRHVAWLEHIHFQSENPQNRLAESHSFNNIIEPSSIANFNDEKSLFILLSNGLDSSSQTLTLADIPFTTSLLTDEQSSLILVQLSHLMDKLFDLAADDLSFSAMIDFVRALIHASAQELIDHEQRRSKSSSKSEACNSLDSEKFQNSSGLLLNRICQLILRILTDPKRTMLAQLNLWSIVSSHLIDVACSSINIFSSNQSNQCTQPIELAIRQKALLTLHESIMIIIMTHQELPHFHTNEALCKPFEIMVRLELCDSDLQDRLISCICELVEACRSGIHRGWRPLFASLSAVRMDFSTLESPRLNIAKDIRIKMKLKNMIADHLKSKIGEFRGNSKSDEKLVTSSLNPNAKIKVSNSDSDWDEGPLRHLNTVREVFEVFINSNDNEVYSNALLDCALCLLRYLPEASGRSTILKVRRRKNERALRLNKLISMRKHDIGASALALIEPNKDSVFDTKTIEDQEIYEESVSSSKNEPSTQTFEESNQMVRNCSMSSISDESSSAFYSNSTPKNENTLLLEAKAQATCQLCDFTLEYLSKCINILLAQLVKITYSSPSDSLNFQRSDTIFQIKSIERQMRICFGDLEPARFRVLILGDQWYSSLNPPDRHNIEFPWIKFLAHFGIPWSALSKRWETLPLWATRSAAQTINGIKKNTLPKSPFELKKRHLRTSSSNTQNISHVSDIDDDLFYGPRTLRELDSEMGHIQMWYLIVHRMARDLPRSTNEKNQIKIIDSMMDFVRRAQLIDSKPNSDRNIKCFVNQDQMSERFVSKLFSKTREPDDYDDQLFFRTPGDGDEAVSQDTDENSSLPPVRYEDLDNENSEDLDFASALEEETPKHSSYKVKKSSVLTQDSEISSYQDPINSYPTETRKTSMNSFEISETYNPEEHSSRENINTNSGVIFCVFMINHIVLPSLQFWVKNTFNHSWIKEMEPKKCPHEYPQEETISLASTIQRTKSQSMDELDEKIFYECKQDPDVYGKSKDIQGSLEDGLPWASQFYEYLQIASQSKNTPVNTDLIFEPQTLNTVRSRRQNSLDPHIIKIITGQVTDLIVEIISQNASKKSNLSCFITSFLVPGIKLMFVQCLDLLVEVSTFYDYSLSRLATSCLKHLLASTTMIFLKSEMYDCFNLAMNALEKSISLNLQSVDILTRVYKVRSDHIYGNFADVRVRTRSNLFTDLNLKQNDSTHEKSKILDATFQNLSNQVFQFVELADYSFINDTSNQENHVLSEKPKFGPKIPWKINKDTSNEASKSQDDILCSAPLTHTNFRIYSRSNVSTAFYQISVQSLLYGIVNCRLLVVLAQELFSKLTEMMSLNKKDDPIQNEVIRSNLHNLLNLMHRIFRCSVDFEQRPGLRMLIQQIFHLRLPATLHSLMNLSLENICISLINLCRENLELFQSYNQLLHNGSQKVRENFLRESLLDSPSGGALKRILEFDFFQSDMPPEFFCSWFTQLWPLSSEKDLYPGDESDDPIPKDPLFLYPVLLSSVFVRATQMYLFLLGSLRENNTTLAESFNRPNNLEDNELENNVKKLSLAAFKRQKIANQMPPPGKNVSTLSAVATSSPEHSSIPKIGLPQQSALIAMRKEYLAAVIGRCINRMLQKSGSTNDLIASNFFGLLLGTPLSNLVACTNDENLKNALATWFASLAAIPNSPK